ncbi:hypothetical protein N7474_009268 [Penicillium riverlandense]|uniref:uncharacterized protein n=1 Tax=Penicillium riverlandense TaxID=1903569 RepID=UPI0025491F00|nr:uncharacterized protein N7474_009268 [Penicillium riverlandense]KAJ5807999.1 hypothetical protein N7474_009268 [Penicillium riverlandense]
MATAEKTQDQQKQFQVPDDVEYSSGEEDYDSADDYDEEEQVPQKNNPQRRRRPLQKAPKDEEVYSDEDDDYASDEYDDDDYYSDDDDDMVQGKSMQPYSQQRSMDMSQPGGGMSFAPQPQQKSILDEEGMKLKLELNLEIEVELKARIHGDLTLALM